MGDDMEKQNVIKKLRKLRKMRDTIENDFPAYRGRAADIRSYNSVISHIERYRNTDNIGLLLKQKEMEFKEIKSFVEKMLPPKKAV